MQQSVGCVRRNIFTADIHQIPTFSEATASLLSPGHSCARITERYTKYADTTVSCDSTMRAPLPIGLRDSNH